MLRRFICTMSVCIVSCAVALMSSTGVDAGERVFGSEPRYSSYSSTTSPSRETLRFAETLSRNFGAVQNRQPFLNQNGDFSYLTLYSSYGGFSGPYLWGGYYGYGGYSPWWYGYRYGFPYRYYPYAFGYPYGYGYYGPTAYYGWPYLRWLVRLRVSVWLTDIRTGGAAGFRTRPRTTDRGTRATTAVGAPRLPNSRYAGCYYW